MSKTIITQQSVDLNSTYIDKSLGYKSAKKYKRFIFNSPMKQFLKFSYDKFTLRNIDKVDCSCNSRIGLSYIRINKTIPNIDSMPSYRS